MRYIDSGRRETEQTLASWLMTQADAGDVRELRAQTGFFGAAGLGFLAPLLGQLCEPPQLTRLLVGSNEGVTKKSDLLALLELAGAPREALDVAIVSFANAFFHPKTVHIVRVDDSQAAYVGSANLTESGMSGLHVEAGILLDTRDGDSAAVLADIYRAIDEWFDQERNGLYRVINGPSSLDELTHMGVLGIPHPVSPRATSSGPSGIEKPLLLAKLKPLAKNPSTEVPAGPRQPSFPETLDAVPEESETPISVVAKWSKALSDSDAQKKASGNQRGSITLVQAGYPIQAQTYFRREFFANVQWVEGETKTGQLREAAMVPILVSLKGLNLGLQAIQITHAPNRESGQNNYATLLHLGPLSPYFQAENLSRKLLTLERRSDGSFALSIG